MVLALLMACGNKVASSEGAANETTTASQPETSSGDPVIEVIYKLNGQEFKPNLSSLYVNFNTETVEDENGKETKNSTITFSVRDIPNNVTFRFHIKDEKVVERFSGQYPLRQMTGFEEGESIRSATIMMVQTSTGASKLSERGGTCEVEFSGTNLKLNIKGANLRLNPDDAPLQFEISLNARNINVERS